jgi:uncharacterized protein
MLINLSDVLSEQHKPIETTVPFELETVELKGGSFPIVSREPVHVVVTHVKDKELQIQADSKIGIKIPCDRCAEDVKEVFVLDFAKRVDLNVSDADLREDLDESNFIDGHHLDVDKLLFNEILIGWPTKVLCSEDCKGICSICGQNLNQGTCDCEDTGVDPRMSVVRDLFKNFKEV